MRAGKVRRSMTPPLPLNRTSGWEWVQTGLLAVNLWWTTLCLGGYRPETMLVTGAFTCMLLAVHLLSRIFEPAPAAHPAGWLLLPFVAYAAANAHWITPVRWLGWRDWMWWAQLIAVFWIVLNGVRSSGPRRTLVVTLLVLGTVAVALACYQRFIRPDWLMLGRVQADQFIMRSSGPFGIPNSLAALLLLLIPLAGVLALRAGTKLGARVAWGALTGFFVFGLVLTISRGAWLGLALALTAWPLASARWSWRRRLGVATGVGAALVLFGAGLYFTVGTVRERLIGFVHDSGEVTRPILWRAAWKLWREHPAVGSGAGSFNVLFEKYRPEQFVNEPQWAHNDYLNTLSDYGAIGFVLFFGVAAFIAWRCFRARTDAADEGDWLDASTTVVALATGLLAFALQLFVDFHFKIPALAMVFATVAALVVQRRWPAQRPHLASMAVQVGYAVVAASVVLGGWAFALPTFSAEALRNTARQKINRLAGASVTSPEYRDRLMESRSGLERSAALDPANAQAWSDMAYAASLWAYIVPQAVPALGIEAETAASRAIALAPACAEFWIRRGVARDMRGRWFDGSLDFVQATTLASNSAWVWFYYADHLSRRASERGLAEAALALCLRLDPQNQDALALRQRLAISREASP